MPVAARGSAVGGAFVSVWGGTSAATALLSWLGFQPIRSRGAYCYHTGDGHHVHTSVLKDLEQIPNKYFAVHGLPEGQVEGDLIPIPPPYPLLVQLASGFEFGDDPPDRPLGEPQAHRDFPRRDLTPLRNQD